MRFEVLGPMRVSLDAADVTPQGRLQRLLLGLLVARAGRQLPVEELCRALWGDPPGERANAKLHLLVHRLRARFHPADRISFGPLGYSLQLLPHEADIEQFLASADALSLAADPGTVVAHARGALACWRGEPFQDLEHPILDTVRNHLMEQRLAVQERLFGAELSLGHHHEILAELHDFSAEHRLNEHVQGLLMRALHGSGRRNDALGVYRRTRELLVDELGLEPGSELRGLNECVLAGFADAAPAPGSRLIPAQLPLGTDRLFGREAELARLDEALGACTSGTGTAAACTVTVTGTAGVGKTALAITWAQRHRGEFPDGQLYADLRGYSSEAPLDPGVVLASFIRAVGGGQADLESMGLGERGAMFRSLVDGQRLLIVLDNARSAEQVRELLPGAGRCFVLVTSRDALPELAVRHGSVGLQVERLGHAACVELLAEVAGGWVHDDAGAAGALAEACARLPMALRLAGEQLRTRPGANLASLVREIGEEKSRLDHLEIGTGPRTDLRAVFSWSYGTLPGDAAHLFAHLGLLPGPDADAETISALAGTDLRVARRLLNALAGANLVERAPGQRYRLHGLLSEYTVELALHRLSDAERTAAISRLIDYYGSVTSMAIDMAGPADPRRTALPAGQGAPALDSSVAWLEAERPSFEALARSAGSANGDRLLALSQALELFLWTQSHSGEAMRLHEENRDRARWGNNPVEEARAEQGLGSLRIGLGDHAGAERHHRRALELYVQANDRLGQSKALHDVGIALDASGRTEAAVQLLGQALELVRAANDKAGTAIALGNLGELQRRLGRDLEAEGSYREALAISRPHGFRRTVAVALRGLTGLAVKRGDYDEALRLAQQSLDQARLESSRNAEARAQGSLGRICVLAGNTVQARRHYDAALAQARCAGSLPLLLDQLQARAELDAPTDPQASRTLYREAIELARKHGLCDRERELRRAHAGNRAPGPARKPTASGGFP